MTENVGLIWLAAAAVLAGAELLIPGVFAVFLAVAAAITGVFLLLFPELPLPAQLLSFAAWSAITVWIGQRWYRDAPVATADPLLNDRAARLVGSTVEVTRALTNGEGRVRVGDGEWPATGPDLAEGARARVTGASGTVLRIEPVEPSS